MSRSGIHGGGAFFSADSKGGSQPGGGAPQYIDVGAGGTVVIPGGDFLLLAQYSRDGADLVLTGPNGSVVVVRGFFALETPPTLATGDGAQIGPDLAARLAGPASPGQYAQAAPGGAGQAIGEVTAAEGAVTALRTDGTRVQLAEGDPVFEGDVLQTGADASVKVLFADGTQFALGESARMTIDELIYDPGADQGSALFSLVQGTFSFVSGAIAHTAPDAMMIRTPVAQIGIRGTELLIKVDQSGQLLQITIVNPSPTSAIQLFTLDLQPIADGLLAGHGDTMSFVPGQPPARSTLSDDQIQQQYGTDAIENLTEAESLGDIAPAAGAETTTFRVTLDEGDVGDAISLPTADGEIVIQVVEPPPEPPEPLPLPPPPPPGDQEPVNEAPSVSLINTTASLAEDTDTSLAAKVADIVVTDDALGSNVLTLSGADAGLFEIVGTELRLTAGAALDFETNPSLDVTVEVDDAAVGGTPDSTAPLSIAITPPSNAGDDLLVYTSGDGDQTFDGGPGTDTLQITGDAAAANTFTVAKDPASDNVFVTQQAIPLPALATLTVDNVEDLVIIGGSGADIITVGQLSGTDIADSTITINGTAGDDTLDAGATDKTVILNGDGGDDTLTGGSANDTLEGGSGNDSLDGGSGTDTAVFSGNAADYTITQISPGTITITDDIPGDGDDGTDTATNVELLQFADQTIIVPDWTITGTPASVAEGSAATYTVAYTGATLASGQTVSIDLARSFAGASDADFD
ncbi:MAG: FecR domain-containing protein, partial [Phycisphaerae bacterium]